MGIYNTVYNFFTLSDINNLIAKSIIALLIIFIGIFLGKIIAFGLKKLSKKLKLQEYIRGSFIQLIIVVIKWSIYVIFINLGLQQLKVPSITNFLSNILIVIPAFVAALALLAIGFAIAIYIREVIEDAEITGWDLISKIFFYFVLYIFGVYALKVALISFAEQTTDYIIISFTIVLPLTIAYIVKKKQSNQA